MKVLFIIENDFFPRDARVYNEVISLSKKKIKCYVVAPKKRNQKFFEKDYKYGYECYRYPYIEVRSLIFYPFEYLISLAFILLLSTYLVIFKGTKIFHVGNPPDLIIPSLYPLKIFKVKFIFDMHDISLETFKAKVNEGKIQKHIISLLENFERFSVYLSNIVITTNQSIKNYIQTKYGKKEIYIVRNSNNIIYNDIFQINKKENQECILGYFGILNNDRAAGVENIVELADNLVRKNFKFSFIMIGEGSGFITLKQLIKQKNLDSYFRFYGFLEPYKAFEIIKNFDFGILPWPDLPKNHVHTAMKIMDYMCCGVPVCTLKLKEQIETTKGIGIHTTDFKEMSDKIIDYFNNKLEYQKLRFATLEHFNKNLSWEIQEKILYKVYFEILNVSRI